MWHLISTALLHLRNAWMWAQRNPFPVVCMLHGIFLILCCFRYVSSITIQLQRKLGAAGVILSSPHPVISQEMTDLRPKKETIKNSKKPVKKTKKPVEKVVKKIEQPISKKAGKLISEKLKKEPEKKVIKPVQQPIPVPEPKIQEVPVVTPVVPVPAELQVNMHAGDNLVHQSHMTPGELLHVRILESWKPPKNVRPKSPCVVRIMVGKGVLETKPEVISSSGSSAFDMSARRVLLEMKYPQELWHRAITIHFS